VFFQPDQELYLADTVNQSHEPGRMVRLIAAMVAAPS
jgi:hypothetical protein